MVPLGEILDPLDLLIRGERSALIIVPLFTLGFGYVVFFESPVSPLYFLIWCIIMAVFFYFGLKRYRRLKSLYHKIEDWPYTSKEALIEAHAAITSHLSKLKSSQGIYMVLPFLTLPHLLKNLFQIKSEELFTFKITLEKFYILALLILLAVITSYFGKKNYEKSLTRDYREPLARLQEIIDRFERV